MKKTISLGLVLSISVLTQLFTMDRVGSNQKRRNEHLSRETASPITPRKSFLEQKKEKEKQTTLKRSQERYIKYSGEYNK